MSDDEKAQDPETEDATSGEEDRGQDGEESDEQSSDSEPVELLALGREKRKTAGNRLSSLLNQEADDDDVNLLFAETEEEDNEFREDGLLRPSDDEDDSSSDDEDQGPAAADDDLEGEDQLQKEERQARQAQKRKADKIFTNPNRAPKRVKIDPSATQEQPKEPKPRKRRKHDPASMGLLRQSSRTLSVQNKERTMKSIKEGNAKRRRQVENMAAAAAQRKEEKKPMTQEERLEEAARVECLNSQSLTKWEEMEEERQRKQRARLEAMQNRRLEGPIIRWSTRQAEWQNGKVVRIGKARKVEEIKEEVNVVEPNEEDKIDTIATRDDKNPPLDPLTQEVSAVEAAVAPTQENSDHQQPVGSSATEGIERSFPPPENSHRGPSSVDYGSKTADTSQDTAPNRGVSEPHVGTTSTVLPILAADKAVSEPRDTNQSQSSVSFLDGIDFYASMQDYTASSRPPPTTVSTSDDPATPQVLRWPSYLSTNDNSFRFEPRPKPLSKTLQDSIESSAPHMPGNETAREAQARSDVLMTPTPVELTGTRPSQEPHDSKPAFSVRNTVSLVNFDSNAVKSLEVQRRILFDWTGEQHAAAQAAASSYVRQYTKHKDKVEGLANPASTLKQSIKPQAASCAMTSQPAKYKDPLTGLPYASVDAFKALRKLIRGKQAWNSLLGTWGELSDSGEEKTQVASGVPDVLISGVSVKKESLQNVEDEARF